MKNSEVSENACTTNSPHDETQPFEAALGTSVLSVKMAKNREKVTGTEESEVHQGK